MGIVNGTTNYILDQMTTNHLSFDVALRQAQELGFAEADPTADIEGKDAAAKAAILAGLAFHTEVHSPEVFCEGISSVTEADIQAADQMGCVVKLLAVAKLADGDRVIVKVHPAMVPKTHPLASVSGAYNAIFVESVEAGQLMFLGQGAGGAQGWAASVQRRSGLAGMFCQGPWMERERATMIMCPVAGPAVPPTAETR